MSQPSWILIPGRVRPVGVGLEMTSPSSLTDSGAKPSSSRTLSATLSFSASTTTLGASEASSSAKRLATQPVATTRGAPGISAALRTAFLVLASASAVTAHVLITIA